jgi:hypothetical protein
MAEAPPAPSPSYGGESEKKAMADYDESSDDYRSEPTTVAAAPARPAGGATPPDRLPEPKTKPTEVRDGEQKPEDSDPQKQVARQIIYTAEMQISVFKLDEAMERAESLTLEPAATCRACRRATTSCGSRRPSCAG